MRAKLKIKRARLIKMIHMIKEDKRQLEKYRNSSHKNSHKSRSRKKKIGRGMSTALRKKSRKIYRRYSTMTRMINLRPKPGAELVTSNALSYA